MIEKKITDEEYGNAKAFCGGYLKLNISAKPYFGIMCDYASQLKKRVEELEKYSADAREQQDRWQKACAVLVERSGGKVKIT